MTGILARTLGDSTGSASRLLRFSGAIGALAPSERRALQARATNLDAGIEARVTRIVADVRARGDAALHELARSLDGVELASLEVPRARMVAALDGMEPSLRRAMERAAANITSVHRAFMPAAVEVRPERGIVVGRRPDPLRRVGVYAPGGRAVYPSSVLMAAIPARVAGVGELILASPPQQNGRPADAVLAAAALADVDRVFAVGGAGAIAALALGTESVPRVDRIVGPGNAYVAAAKLQLSGEVGIDCAAGPSELLVIADRSADPRFVALEMIAQAEHDPMACVVAVALSDTLAIAIEQMLKQLVPGTPRREVVTEALASRGAVLSADTLATALAFANDFAAEHLLLALADPGDALQGVRNAGTVFVGQTSVAFGDYITGANHVLPTGGTARWASGLSPLEFVRWTTYQRVEPDAQSSLSEDVGVFARAEGLPAHASASSTQPPGRPNARSSGRRDLAGIPLYRADRSPVRIDLSDNTNRWGMPPSAARAIRAATTATVTRYPDPYAASLKQSIAGYCGVDSERVVTGCGSDDVLDAAIRAVATPGQRLATCDPSFVMLPVFARLNGLEPVAVPLTAGYDIDAAGLRDANAAVIYVCSPNNPTGTVASRAAIEAVVDNTDALVIIDEAYAEFADADCLDLARTRPNVLVVRTMSKAFGIAGLRVGYGVGAAGLVREVEKARGPFKVNALAATAANAALREDLSWMREQVGLARLGRGRLRRALERRGITTPPSSANFIFVPLRDADAVARHMREHGVAVRAFTALPWISAELRASRGQALRITVGTSAEVADALDALDAARAACA